MSAKNQEVYKCEICGIIVNVNHGGGGKLSCCGQPMDLLEENSVDAAVEKHVPALENKQDGIHVKVGTTLHPMDDDHYIEWIEALADGKQYIKYLKPGEEPEASFPIAANEVKIRAYCNLHGLWKA